MKLKFEKHKKVVLWSWFFLVFYTFVVFIVLTQYIFNDTVIELDLFFVKYVYDVKIMSVVFTFFYLVIVYSSYSDYIKESHSNRLNHKANPKLFANLLKRYCILFNFFFVWPLLFTAVSDFPLWSAWKIVLWISPLLFYFLRLLLINFVWSAKFVRKFFKWKDSDVWNCPACHEYILKRPVSYCFNCWNKIFDAKSLFDNKYCKYCFSKYKVKDFDFPRYCPHCWLRFKCK